jgi:hypothetical protein
VITKPDILQDTFEFNKQEFKSFAKLGGHTYMSSKACGAFTRLVTSKNSIFKVSVKLNNQNNKLQLDDQETIVWDAMTTVLRFIETKSTRTSIQGRLNADLGLDTKRNVFKTCVGPMFPLLTCVYLASLNPDGIVICMESYNTKAYDVVDFLPTTGMLCTIEEATLIADSLSHKLFEKVPMLLDRTSKYLQVLSKKTVSLYALSDSDIEFIWGVGCTVETYCEIPKQNIHVVDPVVCTTDMYLEDFDPECESVETAHPFDILIDREFEPEDSEFDNLDIEEDDTVQIVDVDSVSNSQTNTWSSLDQLETLKASFGEEVTDCITVVNGDYLNRELFQYEPGYAVIQVELPPFAELRDQPKLWFHSNKKPVATSTEQVIYFTYKLYESGKLI